MNGAEICGWLVVDSASLRDGSSVYRGIGRDPWTVVGDGWHSKTLPARIRELYAGVRAARGPAWWLRLARDHSVAQELLSWARQLNPDAELLGLRSPDLMATYSTFPAGPDARFLGYDVHKIGEWSLLREMTEQKVLVSSGLPVNEHALLFDASDLERTVAIYWDLTRRGLVEELGKEDDYEVIATFDFPASSGPHRSD